MIKNYLKIAYRTLKRRKGYTFINVFGLAVGLAACLLIGGWVQHQLSYDEFHEKAGRIYRVVVDAGGATGQREKMHVTQPVLKHALDAELPAIEKAVRLRPTSVLFRHGRKQFNEENVYQADPAVLEIFSFPLLRGNSEMALDEPGSVVLSKALAEKYFGSEDPIGETITTGSGRTLTVTGVLKEIPANSSLQPKALISMSTFEDDDGRWRNWTAFFGSTYVLLQEEASREHVEQAMNRLLQRHADELLERVNVSFTYSLEPLTKVHLYSEYGGLGATGDITNVYVFSLVALFILVLACVNYINLATAQSRRRAREVGVRKSVGAQRTSVAFQFLLEAVLLSALAGLLAAALARFALPAVEALTGTTLGFRLDAQVLLIVMGAALFTGLLAGAYPAFVLSGYRPAEVLKGSGGAPASSRWSRKGLVVFQFAVAIALLAGTGVVYQQLRYMQQQELGFAMREGGPLLTISFGGDEDIQEHLQTVKRRLEQHPDVTGVAASATTPGVEETRGAGGTLERRTGKVKRANVNLYMIGRDFIDLYGLNVIAGRGFAERDLNDSTASYILNETAVRQHGFHSPEEAVGRQATFWGMEGEVIGVVEDFHPIGLQKEIPSLALVVVPSYAQTFTLHLKTDDLSQTLSELEALWHKIAPNRPFDYAFVSETFAAQYRAERRFGRLFGVFSGLAIFVACLGLFGLAAYAAERRTKEIGIRKTFGASVPSIVALLSKDFLKLVGIAFILAAPVAYFAMRRWLQDFAYRIDLGPWVFVGAGALALVIALLTVSYHAIRAARANPVEALRSE